MSKSSYFCRQQAKNFLPGGLQVTKKALQGKPKKLLRSAWNKLHLKLVRSTGVMPGFMIIGGQKCGTTSLYNYLIQHPNIFPAKRKEVGYFNDRFSHDAAWYRSHFPTGIYKSFAELIWREKFLTGEADPAYILDPFALKAIKRLLPSVKLIVLLRNPADRAFSHYQHTVRIGAERLTFEKAIEVEPERVAEQWVKMRQGQPYIGKVIYYYAYLLTGHYGDQIECVYDIFEKKQVLVLQSENFFRNTQYEFEKVVSFLELKPARMMDIYRRHNKGSYPGLDNRTRSRLQEYFEPQIDKLRSFDIPISWNN